MSTAACNDGRRRSLGQESTCPVRDALLSIQRLDNAPRLALRTGSQFMLTNYELHNEIIHEKSTTYVLPDLIAHHKASSLIPRYCLVIITVDREPDKPEPSVVALLLDKIEQVPTVTGAA